MIYDEFTEVSEVEMTTQLTQIINQAPLELNEGEQIKQSYTPFFHQLSEIKQAATRINFENPTEIDEKIARELRLKTVKIRTGSEEVKENRKKAHMLKANLEQSAWNLIRDTCKLEEENFSQVEKRREIMEKARQEALREERAAEIEPYKEYVPAGLPLGLMAEDDYQKLLNGAKMQHKAAEEAKAKLEAERIERERILALHNERKEILLINWQFVPDHTKAKNFGEFTPEAFADLVEKVTIDRIAYEAEQERIRQENERLRIEKEAAEKKAAEEKVKAEEARIQAEKKAAEERRVMEEKAAKERKQAEEKARKEREEAEKKLAAERAEKAKLEAKLKAKVEADLKAKKEAEAKAKAEEKARIAAEKKAAAAPDREKLLEYIAAHRNIPAPKLSTEEMKVLHRACQNRVDQILNELESSL